MNMNKFPSLVSSIPILDTDNKTKTDNLEQRFTKNFVVLPSLNLFNPPNHKEEKSKLITTIPNSNHNELVRNIEYDNSSPSFPFFYNKEKQDLAISEIEHLHDCIENEKRTVEKFLSKIKQHNLQGSELLSTVQLLNFELTNLWTKKSRILSYLVEENSSILKRNESSNEITSPATPSFSSQTNTFPLHNSNNNNISPFTNQKQLNPISSSLPALPTTRSILRTSTTSIPPLSQSTSKLTSSGDSTTPPTLKPITNSPQNIPSFENLSNPQSQPTSTSSSPPPSPWIATPVPLRFPDFSNNKSPPIGSTHLNNEINGTQTSSSSNNNTLVHTSFTNSNATTSKQNKFFDRPNQAIRLGILQQPSDIAIANRYMNPAPSVYIFPNAHLVNSNNCTYVVSVSLSYFGLADEDEITTTMDGKNVMLQGVKRITIDSSGSATFNRLKIMEVSSKHKHQPFCLVFSLEEFLNGEQKIIQQVKSVPFHVNSRQSCKRKSFAALPPAKQFFPNQSLQFISFNTKDFVYQKDNDNARIYHSANDVKTNNINDHNSNIKKVDDEDDNNYVDITELLILPQKEAAKRLGISESMLCKRFKESTKRKWPYRYLRKIEKVLSHLNSEGDKPIEDKEKLEKLSLEREECLRPVRIRVTSFDKIQNLQGAKILRDSENNKIIENEDDDDNNEEIDDEVLETLENMRKKRDNYTESSSSQEGNDGSSSDDDME